MPSQDPVSAPKNVLLVEDDQKQLERWRTELEDDGYAVTSAASIEQAMELFPRKQWDAIAIDGCIGGDDFNSPPLIREFKSRSNANCILVAASKNPDLAQLMLEAGCTDTARTKDRVPGMIHSILRRR